VRSPLVRVRRKCGLKGEYPRVGAAIDRAHQY
jgi:hypothetical protein